MYVLSFIETILCLSETEIRRGGKRLRYCLAEGNFYA